MEKNLSELLVNPTDVADLETPTLWGFTVLEIPWTANLSNVLLHQGPNTLLNVQGEEPKTLIIMLIIGVGVLLKVILVTI